MKNLFEIQKENGGYSIKITASRRDLLRALINGHLDININAETAASLSNTLYTPKPKVTKPKAEKPVLVEKKPATRKPRTTRKKSTPKTEE